ncbi:hypothetical protein FisN_1Lh162 [Fistulifera solaris]|uniref:Uncharacterized protein n=1 Tax=Fistulifera solaris TaxID=1519565 RepID=A0A1Z5K510_FISSO|nr:hypothetical protein FisN_1Lh162 [Fistulifera solaris]|eukprot:GAX21327.1 hypothetical protein FisN_1Lh162 [Fistulifera solaris]
MQSAFALGVVNRAVLVTGSTDGIGITTAKHLAKKGYDVLIHGRDSQRIEAAVKAVQAFGSQGNKVLPLPPADLSTVQGCRRLVQQVEQLCDKENLALSIIMNNAGVFAEKHVLTEDGLELTFAVNVMAPFVITSLLLPRLLYESSTSKTTASRIVIASSLSQCAAIRSWDDIHYRNRSYSAHAAYSESKLLDAMLTMEFAKRLPSQRITCNCLDPGTVNTKMLLAGWGRIGIEVEDALDETWLCSSPQVEHVTGKYFVNQQARRASSSAYDENERARMWNLLGEIAPDAAQVWEAQVTKAM